MPSLGQKSLRSMITGSDVFCDFIRNGNNIPRVLFSKQPSRFRCQKSDNWVHPSFITDISCFVIYLTLFIRKNISILLEEISQIRQIKSLSFISENYLCFITKILEFSVRQELKYFALCWRIMFTLCVSLHKQKLGIIRVIEERFPNSSFCANNMSAKEAYVVIQKEFSSVVGLSEQAWKNNKIRDESVDRRVDLLWTMCNAPPVRPL